MSLGRGVLHTGKQIGGFFPQENRKGSSFHRRTGRGVLPAGEQVGEFFQQEFMWESSSHMRTGRKVLPHEFRSGTCSHRSSGRVVLST